MRPQSIIGKCLPWSTVHEGDILIALKIYLDRSGEVVLSAIAADEHLWADLEPKWLGMLANRQPQASYLHMKEAISLRGNFTAEKGWDAQKVEQLLRDALLLILAVNKEQLCVFGCHLDLQAYRRLKKLRSISVDYTEICNDFVAEKVLAWQVERRKNSLLTGHSSEDDFLHYYFDQGEPFEGAFRKWRDKNYRLAHHAKGFNYWALVKSITSSSMRHTPGLQVADMLAWALNRSRTTGSYSHMAEIMRQIIPHYISKMDAHRLLELYGVNFEHAANAKSETAQ